MKRSNYTLYTDDIEQRDEYYRSSKNEPWFGLMPYYPDMGKMYDAFSDTFHISKNNFILTNGCENAMRILLEYFKCHNTQNLMVENPGWQLAEVLGVALHYNILKSNFAFNKKTKTFEYDIDYAAIPDNSIIYTTDKYNNLFEHKNIDIQRINNNKGKLTSIIDETYTMSSLRHVEIPKAGFVIGSFSKFFGAGYRLGYILFDDKYNDDMQLLREQYINSCACSLINRPDIVIAQLNKIDKQILNADCGYDDARIVSKHLVYSTFMADDIDLPHKKFTVSGVNFCRIGRNILF